MPEWPRYKIVPDGDSGIRVVDTWRGDRTAFAMYGGSKKEHLKRAKEAVVSATYLARRRIARTRRVIIASGGVTKAHADRIARDLDAAGIGIWDQFAKAWGLT